MTRQLSTLAGIDNLVPTASQLLVEMLPGDVALFLREADGSMRRHYGEGNSVVMNPRNIEVAQWVLDYGQTAGQGTDNLPDATALFVPMVGAQCTVGRWGCGLTTPIVSLIPSRGRCWRHAPV